VAALGQALIPFYTGRIIDYASIDPDPAAFEHTIVLLILVSLGCAIFSGVRGGAAPAAPAGYVACNPIPSADLPHTNVHLVLLAHAQFMSLTVFK
jgi:hypothetical protein